MKHASQHVKPEDSGFRTVLVVFMGLVTLYALYETIQAIPLLPAHPVRLILAVCVVADVLLMAQCAYLFKTRTGTNAAGLALVLLGGMPLMMTAGAIARTGNVFHVEDGVFVAVPLLMLYGICVTRAEMRRGEA